MAMSSALAAGYGIGKDQAQRRSFMPAINTLGNMIRARRAQIGRGRTFVAASRGSGLDAAAAEREKRRQDEIIAQEEKYRYEMERLANEQKEAQAQELIAGEEARRQAKHEQDLRRSQQTGELEAGQAGRQERMFAKAEAYEQAKQGLMMGNKQLVQDAMRKLMPEGAGEDVITYGETEGGARKVTARPREQDVPEFIFHPDGYVGVQFPGREKPVVFENAEEAFKRVLAPMNPQRYSDKGLAGKDVVSERKSVRDVAFKDRKLKADIHAQAHEAAMQQFEADGYYQPALYDEQKYWDAYNSHVERATGSPPPGGKKTPKRGGIPKQYKGDEPPEGFPKARRGPRGGWYVQEKGKWYPILEGKEQSPAAPKPEKAPSNPPRRPGRSPMPTADQPIDMQAAGISFTPQSSASGRAVLSRAKPPKVKKKKREPQVYRGKKPPAEYPDAQWDEEQKAWFYFDENEGWQKVKM